MLRCWGLWAGFGLRTCSHHTAPVHFLVVLPVPRERLELLMWQCLVQFPWEVNVRDHKAFGPCGCCLVPVPVPLPGVHRAGSVQVRPCLHVARSCLDPIVGCFEGANVIGVFICLFYLENPELWITRASEDGASCSRLLLWPQEAEEPFSRPWLLEKAFGWLCSQGPGWRDQGWPGLVSWLDSLGVTSWGWWTRQHSKD